MQRSVARAARESVTRLPFREVNDLGAMRFVYAREIEITREVGGSEFPKKNSAFRPEKPPDLPTASLFWRNNLYKGTPTSGLEIYAGSISL